MKIIMILVENKGHNRIRSMIFLEVKKRSAYAHITEGDVLAQNLTGESLSEQVEREIQSGHNTKLWKAGVIVEIVQDDSHGCNDHNRNFI